MNFWQLHGLNLWGNGYTIVPIYSPDADKKGAGKRPIGEDWQQTINSKEEIQGWARRYTNNGIGILTKRTPAVDIDVYDEDAAAHMASWVEENIGFAPCRIGQEPKRLYLFRTDEPFSKVKSCVWEDDFGQRHAVEILADGQQFVAYGIHPDTHKEYYWTGVDNPLNHSAELDLEPLTLDAAREIAGEFDRYATEQGWLKVKREINGHEAVGVADDDDWASMADVQKWDGTYEDLRDIVMKYPNPEDYESWITVLAALQISCRDQEEAKAIAREWSAQAGNYDEAEFDHKWDKGFDHNAGRLVTLGSIIKTVRDIEKAEAEEAAVDFREGFSTSENMSDWNAWAESFKKAQIFGLTRKAVVVVAAEKYRQFNNFRLTAADKKELLGFDYGSKDTPTWLKNFVFSKSNDAFIDKSTGDLISKGAFDVAYAKKCTFEEEKFKPTMYASEVKPVPMVWDGMYYPEMHGDMTGTKWKPSDDVPGPEFFTDHQGRLWFNTFDPDSIPEPAADLSKYDRKALEIIKDFLLVLFPNEKERGYVMDWMAWVVQNPTKRVNYSLLIRGAHGSGKTTLGILMSAMLGRSNVGYVSNTVMNGRFSEWAEGHILKIVEEIYDKGDRYSAVERQKEFITNDRFQVEPKGRKAKEVVNTSSKMMFTNHFNALPLDENQRRYLVVSTQAENHLDMERVYGSASERSRFFKNVYRAIESHGPAIKKWFLDWDISEKFDAKGHAPQDTEAFAVMSDASGDGVTEVIVQMLREENTLGVNRDVIFSPALKDAFLETASDLEFPKGPRLKNILMELGFKPAGVFSYDSEKGRLYVRNRMKGAFNEDGTLNLSNIRTILKKHDDRIEALIEKVPNPFDDEDDEV